MTRTNRPGPKGTSCLTCKQRHKKCDQRVPVCTRCEEGGFDCLGYDHNSDTRFRGRRTQLPPILPRAPEPSGSSRYANLESECLESLAGPSSLGRFFEGSVAATPAPGLSDPVHANDSEMCGTLEIYSNRGVDTNPPSWRIEDLLVSLCTTRSTPQLMDGPMSIFLKLANLYVQSPYYYFDPLKTFLTNPSFDDYLLAQHGKLMERWYFRPANIQKEAFQQGVVTRLQSSLESFSRWIALIGMGICEAVMKGDASQIQLHSSWTGYIENTLKRELSYDTVSNEAQTRRRDWIHVSLLRTLVTHNSGVYQVLRSLTPVFLQLAFSDPALWPSESGLEYVPLLNVLALGSHEIAYFALIDCTYAMTFGLPQHVEYDTTIYALPSNSPWNQWAHGSPAEFQVVLAGINACRDRSPTAHNWREIEQWLLAWEPQPGQHTFTDSWMTVAWYAVQESWKLALLVYLYLAVCNAPSDDPRIQNCVKQLLQVVGTVKKRKSSSAEVSFLVQYLIAGICARSEAHRKMVRDRLEKPKEPNLWVMRGSDFIPVLDHLWHGAAVGGHPVKWGDYMHSRETMLPIVL